MNPYSKYQQNQVLSASPEQILLMLFDGAIRFTRQAMLALEEDNIAGFGHGISKSMAIIAEFSNSLDHAIGGEIAENLDALYNFMIRELTQANLHKDIEKLRVVDKLLVDLRSTWGEAIMINKQEQIPVARTLSIPKAPYANSPSVPDGYVPLSVSR
ncbi:MAG: flagellar export chaperone FliS [Desulfobulbaceae bacterium]|nr:flagellar export chaperone FliS [Desulfobulbaceae bacterium]